MIYIVFLKRKNQIKLCSIFKTKNKIKKNLCLYLIQRIKERFIFKKKKDIKKIIYIIS